VASQEKPTSGHLYQQGAQDDHQPHDGAGNHDHPQQLEGNMVADAPKGSVQPNENSWLNIDVPESSNKGVEKSKRKPFSYRCLTKGHTIQECNAILCCDFCYGDHVAKACPNIKNTNLFALPYGNVVEGLGFYYIPVFAKNPKEKAKKKLQCYMCWKVLLLLSN